MIKAEFKSYGSYTTDSVSQWDLNQKLTISGLDIDVAPVLAFSCFGMYESIIVQSKLSDGVITCDVPNAILQFGKNLNVDLCSETGGQYKAFEKMIIPVNRRKKPSDYLFTDNVPLSTAESIKADLEKEINSNKTYTDKVKAELKNDNKTLNGRIDTILTGTVNTTKLVTVHSATIRNNSASDLTFKISSKDNETLKSIKDKSPTVIDTNVIAKALDGVAINGKGIPSSYNVESTNDEYVITVYSGSSSVVGQYVFMAVATIAYKDTATDISSAELKDIRTGANGTTYPTAGDAVRGQINDLKKELDDSNLDENVSQIQKNMTDISQLKESKVQKPIDNGTDGQFLKNNGDGTTEWSNIDTDLKDNAITVTKLTANTAKGLYSVKEPNYVNKNKVCRKSDGTITGYANINCTDYLETDNIVGIICDHAVSFNNFYAITFLDDTKKVISGIDGTEDLGGGYKKTTKLLSIPDNSKYCVINNFTAHPSSITILEKYTNNSLANKALELTNCLSKTIPINTLTPLKDAKKCIAKIKTSKPSTVHIYKRNIIPEYEDGTYTASGVTVTVKNNRITLNGTVTGNGGVGLKVKKTDIIYPGAYYATMFDANGKTIVGKGLSVGYGVTARFYFKTPSGLTGKGEVTTSAVNNTTDSVYIGFYGNTGQKFENYEIYPQIEVGQRTYKFFENANSDVVNCEDEIRIAIDEGYSIYIESEDETTTATIEYSIFSEKYCNKDDFGTLVEKPVPNPDWWGWSLPDGDAYFKYNCDPNFWPQYKEINGPMLIRGQLVVGAYKEKLGGDNYKNTYPARYGFHVFEGVGNEEDKKRVTICAGKFKDVAALFYFKTPKDGNDANLDSRVNYGWIQLGSDESRGGVWINDKTTRFFSPICFATAQTIESNSDTVEIDAKNYAQNVQTEELYPEGTMYYNKAMGKVRVKTSNGWKTLSFES